MALVSLSSSTPLFTFTRLQPTSPLPPRKWHRISIPGPVQCAAAENYSSGKAAKMLRRTGNYPPSIWDHDFFRSVASDYVGERYTKQLEKLKEDVKMTLGQVAKPLDQLELIDSLQRLGIYYHFGEEIKRLLHSIYSDDTWKNLDLYATALAFRLLRQHGYHVPQDVIDIFINEMEVHENMEEIICVFEASYLSIEGENILEEARDFTRKILEEHLEQKADQNDDRTTMLVKHALELPLHWRIPRLDARWFIDVYERTPGMNPTLLELAVLDYNMMQATYQEELKHVSL